MADEAHFYPCYPEAVVYKPNEAIHSQMVVENAPDTTNFHFTRRTPDGPQWSGSTRLSNRDVPL